MEQNMFGKAPSEDDSSSGSLKWFWIAAAISATVALVWIFWLTAKANNLGFDKEMWDWMELLLVPAALVIVAVVFDYVNRRSDLSERSRRHASEQRTEHQRTVEAFLEYVSYQVLTAPQPDYAEAQRVVLRTYILEALDSLSTDGQKQSKAVSFLHELELLLRKEKRHRPLEIEPLLVGATLIDFNGSLINPRRDDKYKALAPPQLSEIDFSQCVMLDCRLNGADLRGACFNGADLSGAQLCDALLNDASLRSAQLGNATLAGADVTGAQFASSYLQGTRLIGIKGNPATFDGCTLLRADLSGADLRNASFEHASLHEAIVDDRTQLDPKWRLVWEILNLERGHSEAVDDRQLDLFAALDDSPVAQKSLRGQDLSYADLTGADLRDFDLAGANLGATILLNADLTGADLTGADLTGADLAGADLSGADLRGAIVTAEQLEVALNVPEREVW